MVWQMWVKKGSISCLFQFEHHTCFLELILIHVKSFWISRCLWNLQHWIHHFCWIFFSVASFSLRVKPVLHISLLKHIWIKTSFPTCNCQFLKDKCIALATFKKINLFGEPPSLPAVWRRPIKAQILQPIGKRKSKKNVSVLCLHSQFSKCLVWYFNTFWNVAVKSLPILCNSQG